MTHAAHLAVPPTQCLNGCYTGAGAGDARQPVEVQPPAQLCAKCTTRLDGWLRVIPDAYALLPSVLDHGTVPGNPETAHTKRPDAPAPMRLEIVDLLDARRDRGALGLVHSWARVVRAERHIHDPCTTCTHLAGTHWVQQADPRCTAVACGCTRYQAPDATVAGECAFLGQHLAWITEQDWAGELYAELRQLARQLSDAVGEFRPKPVGYCMALAPAPGAPVDVLCGGPLMMDRSGYGVECGRCGNRHEANHELRELGLKVGLIGDNGNDQEAS